MTAFTGLPGVTDAQPGWFTPGVLADVSTGGPTSGTGALALTGTATVTLTFAATASASLSLSGASTGTLTFPVTAAGVVTLTATATNVLSFASSGAGDLELDSSCAVRLTYPVTAAGSLALAASGVSNGELSFPVTAAAVVTLTATASIGAPKITTTGLGSIALTAHANIALAFPRTLQGFITLTATGSNPVIIITTPSSMRGRVDLSGTAHGLLRIATGGHGSLTLTGVAKRQVVGPVPRHATKTLGWLIPRTSSEGDSVGAGYVQGSAVKLRIEFVDENLMPVTPATVVLDALVFESTTAISNSYLFDPVGPGRYETSVDSTTYMPGVYTWRFLATDSTGHKFYGEDTFVLLAKTGPSGG